MIRVSTLFGVAGAMLAAVLVLSGAGNPSFAQDKKPSASNAALTAGVKAFDAGKTDTAITSLTAALRAGGLEGPQMAKALYYRGVAFRKSGKPAQAISDLTSALWIKGGLTDSDRNKAIAERQTAYREAGLGDTAPATITPDSGVPSPPSSSQVALKAEAPAKSAAPPPSRQPAAAANQSWQTTKAVAAPAATAGNGGSASGSTSLPSTITSQLGPPPSTGLSAMPAGQSSPPPSTGGDGLSSAASSVGESISNSLSGVGSFFSTMFSSNAAGSGDGSTSAATSPVATLAPVTSTGSTAPAAMPAPPSSATSAWNSTTMGDGQVAKPAAEKKVAALAPPAAPKPSTAKPVTKSQKAPAKAAALGKFKLQVAALRSEAEAQKVAQQLRSEFGSQIGAAGPEIDAAAIGNMGTFYRVRVGPYGSIEQPKQLCAVLRPKGFDCLVVTN